MKKSIASIFNVPFSNLKFVLFFCCFFFIGKNLAQANSNSDYLTIVVEAENGEVETVIYYPAGTTFLAGNNARMSADYYPEEGRANFRGDVQLTIYPAYRKDKPEKIDLKNKIVTMYFTGKVATAAGFGNDAETGARSDFAPQKMKKQNSKSKPASSSNDIFAEKIVTPSKKNAGEYNVEVTFSNGIIFKFEDGKASATFKDEKMEVKNNQLLETEIGFLKVSFNPENAELWWVFEKNQAE